VSGRLGLVKPNRPMGQLHKTDHSYLVDTPQLEFLAVADRLAVVFARAGCFLGWVSCTAVMFKWVGYMCQQQQSTTEVPPALACLRQVATDWSDCTDHCLFAGMSSHQLSRSSWNVFFLLFLNQ
jgi:hypothetical protein